MTAFNVSFSQDYFIFFKSILTLVICPLPLIFFFLGYSVYYCVYSVNESSLGSDVYSVIY